MNIETGILPLLVWALAGLPAASGGLDFTVRGTLTRQYEDQGRQETEAELRFQVDFAGCDRYLISFEGNRPPMAGDTEYLWSRAAGKVGSHIYSTDGKRTHDGRSAWSAVVAERTIPRGGPRAYVTGLWMAYVQHCEVDFSGEEISIVAPYAIGDPRPGVRAQLQGVAADRTAPQRTDYIWDGATNLVFQAEDFVEVGEGTEIPKRFTLEVNFNDSVYTAVVDEVRRGCERSTFVPELPEDTQITMYDGRFTPNSGYIEYSITNKWPSKADAMKSEAFKDWARRNPSKVPANDAPRMVVLAVMIGVAGFLGVFLTKHLKSKRGT